MTLPNLINWNLLKNPLNWVVVVLMLIFAAVACDLVRRYTAKKTQGE